MVPLSSLPDSYLLGLALWCGGGVLALIGLLKMRRRWRGRPGRQKALAATLGLGFCLAVLTLIEIGFALFYDTTDSFKKTAVSERWYDLHVRTNAAGFRDEHPLDRTAKPGQRRIVFVGDSFTFGHGVEVSDRFSDRIALALEQRSPGKDVVSNASLPGLSARELVDALVPQVLNTGSRTDVLVYTFVPNDIETFDERTGEFYQSLASNDPQWFPFRGTYFFNLLYYRFQQIARPSARGYYGYLAESYDGVPWQRMESKLDELVALCRSRRVELRIVAFPFLQNLGSDDPFLKAQERIVEFCRTRDIPCVDLRPVLAKEVVEHGGSLVVNRWDAHPNARCHAIAAEAILGTILKDE